MDGTDPSSCSAVLCEIVQLYLTRKRCEDVNKLEERGGMDAVFACLGSSPAGLTDEAQVTEHLQQFGANAMPKKETTPLFKLMWVASSDPMLRVLILASIVSFTLALVFGENKKVEWIEGFAIFVAVMIVICVTAGNDYIKEKRFAELYDHEESWVQVVRGGEKARLLREHVVVGDVLYLEAGDELPADALLIQGHNVKVDESALTGESEHIVKASQAACIASRDKQALATNEPETTLGGSSGTIGPTLKCDPFAHHRVPSPVLVSGSTLTAGSGHAIIIATGAHSQMGQLYSKLIVDNEPTPLQMKLNAMARDVGMAGLIAALVTLVVLIVEYSIELAHHRQSGSKIAATLVEYIVTAITIVVVAVPEGLPLAVTISLAFSVGRMLQDQNYVRRLAACETMGGASEICSDKTGTLTKNQMEVESYWDGSAIQNLAADARTDLTRSLSTTLEPVWPSGEHLVTLLHNIAINSNGFLVQKTVPIGNNEEKIIQQQVGSPTDCALIGFASRHPNFNVSALRAIYKGLQEPTDRLLVNCGQTEEHCSAMTGKKSYTRYQLPFSSEKKVMTTICVHPSDPTLYRVFTKGAAEIVLHHCVSRVDSSGNVRKLDADKRRKIESQVIQKLASVALRTICLAYRDMPISEVEEALLVGDDGLTAAPFEVDLTCLAIVGIRDPLREEVQAALRDCKKAGVRVRMCTGDNIETARQIALRAGIYQPELGGLAMHGSEFLKVVGGVICKRCRTETCACELPADALVNTDGPEQCKPARKMLKAPREDVLKNAEEFAKIADRLEVLARSQPSDKYALVVGLKSLGRVVAVTGDGTNDAPALKKADVGFAMGITGKETAKQAADIVLMDDNFSSIVKAILWGRNVYDNIQRFLQFQLTVNIVAVITAFVGACLLRASPLTAVQLLWVNLIMDTFAALALATELPTDKLLNRPPHSRREYLVSKCMWRNIIMQALYQTTVMGLVIFRGECFLPEFPFSYDQSVDPNYSVYSTCGYHHVRSGRAFHPFTSHEDYKERWLNNITPSRHFTYVFNIFVMMQAFNLVCSRQIGKDNYNILRGLHRNPYWIGIMTVIVLGQLLIVQFGGRALSVHKDGLTWQQWLICLAFGLGSWAAYAIGLLLPSSWVEHYLPESHNKEVNPLNEPANLALASRGRISSGRIGSRMNLRVDSIYQQSGRLGGGGYLAGGFLQPPPNRTL